MSKAPKAVQKVKGRVRFRDRGLWLHAPELGLLAVDHARMRRRMALGLLACNPEGRGDAEDRSHRFSLID